MSEFSSLASAIQQGIDRNLHTGVQVYVSVDCETVLNDGFGMAAPDQQMTSSTIMLWRSAGKPITVAAIARLWQNSTVDLDAPLSHYLPNTAGRPVGEITIRQILTHTSGMPILETGWPQQSWTDILERVCNVENLNSGNAYQPQSTWFLMGAVLEAIDSEDRSLQSILREDVLNPVGMVDSWCGIEDPAHVKDRTPQLYSREGGKLVPSDYNHEPWLTTPSPGGNFRGPVKELGRFYEMLLNDGQTQTGDRYLETATIAAMTSRHRAGLLDSTFQHIVDFGLGVIVDSNTYGVDTVPYGFSRHCSSQTFGHGGAQCAMGFCDAERRLVVAWAANGFCGEGQHQRRNRAINEAIFQDLGFASPEE